MTFILQGIGHRAALQLLSYHPSLRTFQKLLQLAFLKHNNTFMSLTSDHDWLRFIRKSDGSVIRGDDKASRSAIAKSLAELTQAYIQTHNPDDTTEHDSYKSPCYFTSPESCLADKKSTCAQVRHEGRATCWSDVLGDIYRSGLDGAVAGVQRDLANYTE